MSKQILFSDEARKKIQAGVTKLAKAVKVTLGPTGRHVLLQSAYGPPTVTKDGVSVAKEVILEDPFENIGAQMVNEVASKTSDVAGDGTTTATVLAEAIFNEGLKALAAGVNPLGLRRGIEKAVKTAIEEIRAISRPVEETAQIKQVATISANQDEEIGALVAEAMEKTGKDGVITVQESQNTETTLDWADGMQFDRGYLSPYFINDMASLTCELENPLILLHDKKITSAQSLVPTLELAVKTGKPLLIVSENIEGEALALLIVNKMRGVLDVGAVKAPGFGERRKEILGDLAVLTGGTVISADTGTTLDRLDSTHFGTAKRVTITKDKTTIVDGAGSSELIKDRCDRIRSEIEVSKSEFDQEKLGERLAKLSGGVAILRIGASTEIELKEKKARVDDALHATRAAVAEGVVPGGGVALLRAIPAIEKLAGSLSSIDEQMGATIIKNALSAPLRQIAENAGQNGGVIAAETAKLDPSFGYDALTGDFVDMFEAGILDPTKVTRSALEHAASVASLMLTTETVVVDKPEEQKSVVPERLY